MMAPFFTVILSSFYDLGSDLIPLTKEEALEFAEKYLDIDEVKEHFGDMIEDA